MASKWFKPDPPGTSKPTIRPLNDTLAVTQLPDPAPKPVYVPYIPQQAKNSSSKKAPKFKTSDKNSTNPVGPSVPYMYDLPKIPGNATKTREGYTPKVISDKYPDPLAAYLPPRKPTVYTPPNPFLQLNRFSKKPAPATTTAPKPRKLSPVRTPTSQVRDLSEDEQDEILFDTRPSFPVGPPPPVNPVKPRSTFVAPNVPDKPVYAIMAKIRDRNLKFEPSNDNHPKTALKRPHQQWEPRWDPPPPRDSRPSYSFPSTSTLEKPSRRKGKLPKKPPKRSRKEQGERTQFVPYEPIDADFDTDFHNYMLRQPKYYESDNFNFDFTRRPMPDNWKPDLTVFDCVAAEMERDLEARISGKTRKTTGKKMEFDDLDSYDAHNMFDFSKFSGPADDFEYEPPSRPPQDDEDYGPSPKQTAKKSIKTVEEDGMIVEETEKLTVGLEVPKKRSKIDTTGMKFRSPPPLQPEHRGAAYVKARKIEIPKEEPKMKATIELPKNCKLFQYTWTSNGKTQNILVPMSSTATRADVEKLMPELLNAPENRFEMTKLEEKKMFLGSSDNPNQPVFDPKKPVFVNPKQYHRILERRKTRLRQKANGILAMLGKDNMQESRHNYASNKERMGEGWVLNEEEQEEEEEDDVTVLEDSDEEKEDQEAEPYLSMPLRKIRPDPLKKSFKRKPKPDPHLVRWGHLLKPVPLRSVPVPPSGTPLGKDAPLSKYRPSPVVTRIPPMAARSSNRPIAPVGGGQPPVKRTMFPLRQPPGSSAPTAPSGTSTTTPTEPASTSDGSNPRAPSESLSEAPTENPDATPLLDHSRLLLTRIGNAPKEYPTPVSVFIPHLPVGASTNPPAAPKTPKTPKSKPPALVGQPEPADRPKGPSGSNAAPYCPQGRWAQFSSEAQEKKSDPAPGASDPTTSTPGSSNPPEVAPAESTNSGATSTPCTTAPKPLHRPAPGSVPPPYQPQRQWANLKSSTPGTSKPSVPRPKGSVSLHATSTPGAAPSQTVSRPTPTAAGSSTPGAASTSSSPAVPRPGLTSQRVPSSSTSSTDSEPPGYREQVRSVQLRILSPFIKNFPHRPPMQQSAPNVIRPQVYCKETAPRLEQRNQTIRVRTTNGRIASMSPAQYEQCKARMLAAKREKEKVAEKNAVKKGEEQQSEDIAIEKEVEKQAEKELEKGIAAEKTVVEKEAEKTVLKREVEKELHKEKAQENDIVEKETEKQ